MADGAAAGTLVGNCSIGGAGRAFCPHAGLAAVPRETTGAGWPGLPLRCARTGKATGGRVANSARPPDGGCMRGRKGRRPALATPAAREGGWGRRAMATLVGPVTSVAPARPRRYPPTLPPCGPPLGSALV